MLTPSTEPDFPCSLTISLPLPTHRLANAALRALSVDQELSPLGRRSFSLTSPNMQTPTATKTQPIDADDQTTQTILRTEYKATTNRMLRVAVNGFFESVGVVLQCMEELDVDVLHEKGLERLEGAQGIEQGLTGSTAGVAG
ncbi:hypothetical protein B0A49_02260 [Cryomyces minteri]|uniref:Pcc1-domain-containing protein n=1 Tax=Cryomyces minteri TaxID=331657 RepID=A0A4U0XFC1_9PEZI|nr:hypothetical protein B0A49_02260 [Cryomyces minteri]